VIQAARLAPAAALLLGLAAAAAGCEYFRGTPEQDLANRRWRECAADLRDVKLERVDTDGRIRFSYVATYARNQVIACLEAASRVGPPLPAPVSDLVAGK
jgi:hypothetical protein